eukprot:jgi/Tetstr1/429845/TSEL_019712.t1
MEAAARGRGMQQPGSAASDQSVASLDPSAVDAAGGSVRWDKLADGSGRSAADADPVSGLQLLRQLEEVPIKRRKLYEQWIQEFIVVQSQGWEGYQGTLMYRPELADDSQQPGRPKHDKSAHLVYMIDARYLGAHNMRRWLESEVRAKHVASGIQQQLWDPSTSSAKVMEGQSLTVDYVWSDDPTVPHGDGSEVVLRDGGRTGRVPELALWRLLLFTTLNVWIVVLLLNWPVGSLGTLLSDWPWQASLFVSQAVTVTLVLWVMTPSLQPLLTWWLVQRRPRHWLWSVEPMLTLYEGFPCLRPRKVARPAAAAPPATQDKGEAVGTGAVQPGQPAEAVGELEDAAEAGGASSRGGIRSGADAAAMLMEAVEKEDAYIRLAAQRSSEMRAREAAKTEPLVRMDGPISIIVSHHVHPDKFAEFEAVLKDLGAAATSFSCHEFVGSTIIRPKPGCNLYTAILRFQSRRALEAWLSCEERKYLVAELHRLTMSPVEVRASTHSALELLMSGRRTPAAAEESAGPGGSADARAPPAKFKTWLVILLNLYASSLATGYLLNGSVAGLRLPWATLVMVFLNAAIISYTLVPWTSRLLSRWLDRPRPAWYHRAPWRHAFPLRWLYDGFSRAELHFIDGTAAGLLVAFAASGQMVLPY